MYKKSTQNVILTVNEISFKRTYNKSIFYMFGECFLRKNEYCTSSESLLRNRFTTFYDTVDTYHICGESDCYIYG